MLRTLAAIRVHGPRRSSQGLSVEPALHHGRRGRAGARRLGFSVFRGEFVALIEPSGSGKSTMLNLIGTLDWPSQGELSVDGRLLDEAAEIGRASCRERG